MILVTLVSGDSVEFNVAPQNDQMKTSSNERHVERLYIAFYLIRRYILMTNPLVMS